MQPSIMITKIRGWKGPVELRTPKKTEERSLLSLDPTPNPNKDGDMVLVEEKRLEP